MRGTVIYDTPTYHVVSFGNGASYLFRSKARRREVFFQGDDAAEFRSTVDGLEDACPDMEYECLLATVWEDYGHIAEPTDAI